ncbi:hypothetical protein OSB04_013614 [Centaurea solstitialis]|uniref:Bet v I/Major latex protein domain-containing protein n=1 Tax=Centaurea solstitialis TaxID=347529 RepID=A0AA38TQB1_9ASTR|nr:hypothetical protein OSB04_013614 [Centaurea solstitialis]
MFGTLSDEVEVKVSADKAWQLYGTLELADIAAKYIVDEIEIIEGNGGVGTIIKITFKPGSGISYYKEKYTVVDDEKRVKEAEVIEGGYLDFGFTLFRVRFEIKDSPNDETSSSCLIKTTIEYEVKEEAAANASFATIDPFVALNKFASEHLLNSA